MPRWLETLLVAAASPILLLLAIPTALAVRLSLGSPIFFQQARLGHDGLPFEIAKFRTMTDDRSSDGSLLPDSDRETATGTFLRRYRLDELPAFWNVWSGSMSLVGPRPLKPSVYDGFPEARQRLSVRPGFSGLAQISGNTNLADDEKLAVDLYYIARKSALFDLQIITRTVATLARGEIRNEELISTALEEADFARESTA